jgi:mRNA-degrading endonuclease toxin of MazEF toxin-antitoxin module
MKQWEIYVLNVAARGEHPYVVISSDDVCNAPKIPVINVLMCSSVRGADRLAPTEEGLDEADGLAALSGCQCHSMLLITKDRLAGKQSVGTVTAARQDKIRSKLRALFRL